MKYLRFLLCILLMVSVSSCGLKRNLEKPGHEKYKKSTPDAQPADDGDVDFVIPTTKPAPQPNAGSPAGR